MKPIRSYASVTLWIDNVNRYYHLAEDEWSPRLAALETFCERMGKDPDAIIREAKDEKGAKVEFMRLLNRVAKELYDDPKAAHDWNNAIRSFFQHNGARVVVKPYPE